MLSMNGTSQAGLLAVGSRPRDHPCLDCEPRTFLFVRFSFLAYDAADATTSYPGTNFRHVSRVLRYWKHG